MSGSGRLNVLAAKGFSSRTRPAPDTPSEAGRRAGLSRWHGQGLAGSPRPAPRPGAPPARPRREFRRPRFGGPHRPSGAEWKGRPALPSPGKCSTHRSRGRSFGSAERSPSREGWGTLPGFPFQIIGSACPEVPPGQRQPGRAPRRRQRPGSCPGDSTPRIYGERGLTGKARPADDCFGRVGRGNPGDHGSLLAGPRSRVSFRSLSAFGTRSALEDLGGAQVELARNRRSRLIAAVFGSRAGGGPRSLFAPG